MNERVSVFRTPVSKYTRNFFKKIVGALPFHYRRKQWLKLPMVTPAECQGAKDIHGRGSPDANNNFHSLVINTYNI